MIGCLVAGSPAAAEPGDALVRLPDGHRSGPGVRIDSVGESAWVTHSLAANGAGRVAWVSGNVTVRVTTPPGRVGPNNGAVKQPGTDMSSTHGASTLTVGYLVGCQVDISHFAAQLGAQLLLSPLLSAGAPIPAAGGGTNVPLSAGNVQWVQIGKKDMEKSGTYHFDYHEYELSVQGCGGYAQARQFVIVEVIGSDYVKTALWGLPFSIG